MVKLSQILQIRKEGEKIKVVPTDPQKFSQDLMR